MKRNMLVLAAMVAGLMGTSAVLAQTSTTTRKMTQAECEAARKAGKVVEGECQPDVPQKAAASTVTLKMLQKDCQEARKAGKVVEGECQP
jgi:hypothetical protein